MWARIGQEEILKVRPNIVRREALICLIQSFQTARLEGLLDSLYKEPESLPEQEVSPGKNSAWKYCHFWQQGNFLLVQFWQVRFAELLDQKLERTEVIQ